MRGCRDRWHLNYSSIAQLSLLILLQPTIANYNIQAYIQIEYFWWIHITLQIKGLILFGSVYTSIKSKPLKPYRFPYAVDLQYNNSHDLYI